MSVQQFWNMFEEELTKSVQKAPTGYMLQPDETAEQYAARVRVKMQASAEAKSLSQCNLSTPTFKRLAKRLGVEKFSQGRLLEAYAAMGGK